MDPNFGIPVGASSPTLTLSDLAFILDTTRDIPEEVARRLAPFLLADPRLDDPVAALGRLADQAGLDPGDPSRLFVGFQAAEHFEQLLGASEEWTHPTEILGPDADYVFEELLAIARARREEAGNPHFREVERKLERAAALEKAAAERLRGFVESLLELPGSRSRDLINEARLMLQRCREEAGSR